MQGTARDAVLYARPWGFPLHEVAVPAFLWQGDLDQNVPASHGRVLAESIPDCRATFVPDLGHVSLILARAAVALRAVTE